MKNYRTKLVAVVLLTALLFSLSGLSASGQERIVRFLSIWAQNDVIIGDDLTVADDASIVGDLAVTGASTLTGAVTLAGATSTSSTIATTNTNAAGGSANPIDVTSTLGIMNGSDTYEAIDINITGANHTSTGNVVNAIAVTLATADADATETAIDVTDSNWDYWLDFNSQVLMKPVAAADSAATNEYVEVAFTTPVDTTGSNTHNALTIDLAIGNATGGTNLARGLQIDSITGDAEVTETAINVDGGWVYSLEVENDILLSGDAEILPSATATNSGLVFAAYNTLAYTDSTNKTMFVIPANADILDVMFIITTLFNDSGTDVIACGTTSGDPDEYVDDHDGAATAIGRMGDAADMPIANGDVGATDITVLCKFTGQNGNASAGAANLTIWYMRD